MSAPPATADPEDNIDYIGEDEDDDDDDEEDDFVPGVEEEDEDHQEDDASSTVVPLLDGHLFYGPKHALQYQGEGFHLAASEETPWNLLLQSQEQDNSSSNSKEEEDNEKKESAKQKQPPHNNKNNNTNDKRECQLIMEGPCDFETAGAKATPRKFQVTWTVSSPPLEPNGVGRPKVVVPAGKKSDDDDDFDESQAKQPSIAKTSGLYYRVFGTQIDSNGGDLMEFMGEYAPPEHAQEKVGLVCQVRMVVVSQPPPKAVVPAAAAAAAAVEEEEEDDDENAQVDADELIALHEDAGMSMADLEQRFGRGNRRKRKAAPPPPPPQPPMASSEDEDFEGF